MLPPKKQSVGPTQTSRRHHSEEFQEILSAAPWLGERRFLGSGYMLPFQKLKRPRGRHAPAHTVRIDWPAQFMLAVTQKYYELGSPTAVYEYYKGRAPLSTIKGKFTAAALIIGLRLTASLIRMDLLPATEASSRGDAEGGCRTATDQAPRLG